MGCIKKIVQIFILALALIGFFSIGGKEFVIEQWNKYFGQSQESIMDRASQLGDFSELSEEYSIDKTASAFGYQGVLAEHEATGQKMVILKSGQKSLLTENDFENNQVESKINDLIKKFKYQSLQVDEFTITKTGTMKAYGEEVPYVRFTAKVNKLPLGTIGGVISAVDITPNESRTLISFNENKKYSQLITDEFFKKIK